MKWLVIAGMVALAAAYWVGSRPRQPLQLAVDDSLSTDGSVSPKDFELTDASGQKVSLSAFKGKPILLNFWAAWCAPCLEELPALLEFSDWGKKNIGLTVLAVSVDQTWEQALKPFAQKKLWPRSTLPFTILLNKDGDVATAYGTSRFPESFFISREFKVIRKFVGPQNWTLEEMKRWMTENSR